MTTAPLPPVGGPDPLPPAGGPDRWQPVGEGRTDTRPEGIPLAADPGPGHPAGGVGARAPRWLRGLEVVAGLLSAGVLVLGVGLAVAQVLAPRLGGSGLEAATGPGWDRALAALGVGAIGETLRATRRRWTTTVRAVLAVALVVTVVALLWFTWWR